MHLPQIRALLTNYLHAEYDLEFGGFWEAVDACASEEPSSSRALVAEIDGLLALNDEEQIRAIVLGFRPVVGPHGVTPTYLAWLSAVREHVRGSISTPLAEVEMRMRPPTPALSTLMGAYLNQDCFDFHPDVWAAIDEFVTEDPVDGPLLVDEITALLRAVDDEQDIAAHLRDLGCAVLPPSPAATYRDWLVSIRDRAVEVAAKP